MIYFSKYLPSKRFFSIIGGVLLLAGVVFLIFFSSSKGQSFFSKGDKKTLTNKAAEDFSDFINMDSDSDGIVDWEEELWGTDKNKKITFADTPDATYIENKKKELDLEAAVNNENLTETEKFAREFFASYAALKSSGEVDKEAINSFSNALGESIINNDLSDKYRDTDLKITSEESLEKKQNYYLSLQNNFNKYKSEGLGDELVLAGSSVGTYSGINTSDNKTEQEKLFKIGTAYKNFAKDILKTSVPESLAKYHLTIVNKAYNTGVSVQGMAQIISDPIVGLSGLSQYQKYSEEFVKAVEDLEAQLK